MEHCLHRYVPLSFRQQEMIERNVRNGLRKLVSGKRNAPAKRNAWLSINLCVFGLSSIKRRSILRCRTRCPSS